MDDLVFIMDAISAVLVFSAHLGLIRANGLTEWGRDCLAGFANGRHQLSGVDQS